MVFKLTSLNRLDSSNVIAYAKVPDRTVGDGPHQRLILRGGIAVSGEGATARGPMDIVIEKDRIPPTVNAGTLRHSNKGSPPIAKAGDIPKPLQNARFRTP